MSYHLTHVTPELLTRIIGPLIHYLLVSNMDHLVVAEVTRTLISGMVISYVLYGDEDNATRNHARVWRQGK